MTNDFYDALDRETQEKWYDASGNLVNTINYHYDADGELTSVADDDSAYSYTYDANGNTISIDNAGTPGVPRVILTYAYDPAGNVTSVSETINGQPGAVTSYQYDALDDMLRSSRAAQALPPSVLISRTTRTGRLQRSSATPT